VELSELGSPTIARCGATGPRAENVLSAGEELRDDFVSSMRLMGNSGTVFGFNCDLVADEDGVSGLCTETPKASRTLLPDFLRGRRFGMGGVAGDCECRDGSLDEC
jgi:hypothetical protein